MKLSAPERFWKSGVVAGVCFWMTPFVVFVRFQGYPLTHPETLVCLGILATLGVASGLLMETAGQYSRALVFGLLITLTVDVQVENPGPIWMLITVCVLSVGVMFLLRNHLARAGTAILVVMLVVSFVSPTGKADSRYVYAEQRSPGDESLPVLLHIILDEQIGVEGVPVEFDRDGKHTRALRDFYLEHGFQVFGRAYSRYDNTTATLARLFNFDSSGYRKTGGKRRRQRATAGLAENAYFDLMSSRGYQINVYQTGYFDLCGNMTNGKTSTCFTYGTEAISSIEGSSLSTRRKIRTIFGVYSRLSVILMDLNVPTIRLSAVSAAGIMDELRDDLLRARPGSMFVVHLTLPHYPYAYRADCSMRDPSTWLTSSNPALADPKSAAAQARPGARNDPESRAERYPLYLDQVACTHQTLDELFDALEDAGRFGDMTVVLHGDHGSRISVLAPSRRFPSLRLTKADMTDSFSTLFAFKLSGTQPAYDRRMLPLGPLFEAVIRNGEIPEGTEWAGNREVYFRHAAKGREARPMPVFDRALETQ